MSNCDICTKDLTALDTIIVRSHEFKDIVARGFNPFTEDITFPTGLKLSSLGAAFGLSAEAQYTNWKSQVFANNDDWLLCERCYNCAMKRGRITPCVVTQSPAASSAAAASEAGTTANKRSMSRTAIITGIIFMIIVVVGMVFSFMIVRSRQKRSEQMKISIPAPSAPPAFPEPPQKAK